MSLSIKLCQRIQKFVTLGILCRFQHHHAEALQEKYEFPNSTMSAWTLVSKDGCNKIELSNKVKTPVINTANDVLIKVRSASVNPLDIEMIDGVGDVLLSNMRRLYNYYNSEISESPQILGRDFSGIVVAKGSAVSNFKVGDEVYGVIPPYHTGCHAEYAVTSDSLLAKKPEHLSHEKASAVLYTSLTAWSALKITGNLLITLQCFPASNRKCLILGGSGGVGQSAIQMLRHWGAEIVATCRTDAVEAVKNLSTDLVIDYTRPDFIEQIEAAGPFNIVLDAAGLQEKELCQFSNAMKACGSIIALKSPLLRNFDEHGLVFGAVKTFMDIIKPIVRKGQLIKWGFFMPSGTAVQEISSMVNLKELNPTIEQVYSFNETPLAYERLRNGHARGKIVINFGDLDREKKGH